MFDICFCEYILYGYCGVLCEYGVDNDVMLVNFGKQVVIVVVVGVDFIVFFVVMDG